MAECEKHHMLPHIGGLSLFRDAARAIFDSRRGVSQSHNDVEIGPMSVIALAGEVGSQKSRRYGNAPSRALRNLDFFLKLMRGAVVLCAIAVSPAALAGVSFMVVAEGNSTLAPILKQPSAAVVTISARLASRPGAGKSPPHRQIPLNGRLHPAGSGTIIDAAQGFIITNQHAIDHAEDIGITLADGRELPGTLLGSDADTDTALIKVAADGLTGIPLGDSDEVKVGDFVLAIGNPFPIGRTVSSGIVGGLHRHNLGLEKYEDFIQTEAAIYPGYSGGALINMRGELIGINTAFASAKNVNFGMGFAIPINLVRAVVKRILEADNRRRPGVATGPMRTLAVEYSGCRSASSAGNHPDGSSAGRRACGSPPR
jgi:S1-C subfamily serine protease